MYTRLTGRGRQVLRWECTCTASFILAEEVKATSPSTPAVERPAFLCVTCRTLTNVFDQLFRSNFCRFLTFARAPSCVALKIRCRRRSPLISTCYPRVPEQQRYRPRLLPACVGNGRSTVGNSRSTHSTSETT